MPEEIRHSPFDFLRSKPVMVVTGLLVVEILFFYGISTEEYIPTPPPLEQFAATVGPWQLVRQYTIDPEQQVFLKADDTLSRIYAGPAQIDFFVAFFKSQRAGVTPHSPKVCLPGNGWTPESSRIISVIVPGERASIPVNRYVVSHQEERSLVLYWYENQHRATANEYLSKFYLIYDSLRYRRSDEALIRVITPFNGTAEAGAEAHAIQFIQAVYLPLKQQMWSGGASAGVSPEPFSRGRLP
jgi:EpsI family protein